LLTRFPMRESVLLALSDFSEGRSIARFVRPGWAYGATKDLSSNPMGMRILSEHTELRILRPGWLYGTKDVSSSTPRRVTNHARGALSSR